MYYDPGIPKEWVTSYIKTEYTGQMPYDNREQMKVMQP